MKRDTKQQRKNQVKNFGRKSKKERERLRETKDKRYSITESTGVQELRIFLRKHIDEHYR